MDSENNIVRDDPFLSKIEDVREELRKNVARAHRVLDDRERELLSELQQIEANYRGEAFSKQIQQLKITKEQTISTLTDNENKDFLEQSIATLDARVREIQSKIGTTRNSMTGIELEWDEFLERVLSQTGSIQVVSSSDDNGDLPVEELEWSDRDMCELKNMDSSFWKLELESTVFMKLATSINENGTFWALLQHSQEYLNETFDQLFTQLQSYAECYNWQTNKNLIVGTLCIAQFYLDKKWYRGLIEELRGIESARVRFLDYGNSQITQSADILHLPPQFCQMPFQAILCSMNFTPPCVITETRKDKFSELLQYSEIKQFSSVVKRIDGPIHYINIYKMDPDTTNLFVNEEVMLSDLHIPSMELTSNSWADVMSPVEIPTYFSPTSSHSEWILPSPTPPRQVNDRVENLPTEEYAATESLVNLKSPQRKTNYEPEQNWYPTSSHKEWNNSERTRPNRRLNEAQRSDLSRPKSAGRQLAPYPPSVYLKCNYFVNKSHAEINQIISDILKGNFDHITSVFPDTRSGADTVFIDIDTHKKAIEILHYLNNSVMQIEHHDLRAELALRYKKYLDSNRYT